MGKPVSLFLINFIDSSSFEYPRELIKEVRYDSSIQLSRSPIHRTFWLSPADYIIIREQYIKSCKYIILSPRSSRIPPVWESPLWCRSRAIVRIPHFLQISLTRFSLSLLTPSYQQFYLSLTLVFFHLNRHLRQLFSFFVFLWSWLFGFGQKVGEKSEKNWLLIVDPGIVVFCYLFPLNFVFHVGLGGKDLEGVLHLIELKELLDQLKRVLSLAAFSKFLNFEVLTVERRSLNKKIETFFDEPSWESIVLKTEERICALMLLR